MIASKLNSMDEADMTVGKNPFDAVINKLLELKIKSTSKQKRVVRELALKLAQLDVTPDDANDIPIAGVRFNRAAQKWSASVWANGKHNHLMYSYCKDTCVEAVKKFKLEQGLKRSRRNEFCHF